MPQVSEKLILELQQIIKKEYGKKVSFQEAYEIVNDLVGYFDLLAKIDARRKDKDSEEGN